MLSEATVLGFPLSPQQRRRWAWQDHLGVAEPARFALLFEGPLDRPRLQAAVETVVERFEILRTSFEIPGALVSPLQVVRQSTDVRLEETTDEWVDPRVATDDIEALSHYLTDVLARESVATSSTASLVWRVTSLEEERHLVLGALPALSIDPASLHLLADELASAYRGDVVAGDDVMQYADLAEWLNQMLDEAGDAESLRAARLRLRRADLSRRLPWALSDRPAARRGCSAAVRRRLDGALAEGLSRLAADRQSATETVLLAGWLLLLARLTDAADGVSADGVSADGVSADGASADGASADGASADGASADGASADGVAAVAFDGRGYEELVSAIGPLEKSIPVLLDVAPEATFEALVQQVAATMAQLREWQEVFTWEGMVGSAGVAPSGLDEGEPPHCPYAFTVERELSETSTTPNIRLLASLLPADPYEVALACRPAGEGWVLSFRYDAEALPEAEVERLAERYSTLLADAVGRPRAPVMELALIGETEGRQLQAASQPPQEASPEDWSQAAEMTVHRRFSEVAALRGDGLAVAGERHGLSFRELARDSNRLARRLRALGVGPEVAVGLFMERTPRWVTGLLATLKAGGAYVPLDPTAPGERLRRMLASSGALLVLTEAALRGDVPEGPWKTLCLDAEEAQIRSLDASPLPETTRPENLCYIIFTSGSSGDPKGVGVEHRQLVHYVAALEQRLALSGVSHFASVSTVAADLGNTSIFGALLLGGSLELVDRQRAADPGAYAELPRSVDCLKIVPGHLQGLLSVADPARVLPRRRLVLGGEACSWDLVAQVRELAPECAIFNHYGPTEATVGALAFPVMEAASAEGTSTVPIGRPLARTRAYVVDPRLQRTPFGVPGEALLAGAGLSRGYLGQPAATAAAFLPDPFAATPGERLYRTGDRVRQTADSSLEFLGRTDEQIKIRGFRIEPGEVSAALGEHPRVREAAVTLTTGNEGEPRLTAYVVAPRAEPPGREELRAFLRQRLLKAMMPAAYVFLERLPRTANGKIDRAALPAPEAAARGPRQAPRSLAEERLVAIWSEVLGREVLSVEHNFFDLGGHSLLAMQLVSRVNEVFSTRLPLHAFVEEPTVAALARRLDEFGEASDEEAIAGPQLPILTADPEGRHQPFPLTDVQQAYWIGRSASFELGNVSTHAYLEVDFADLDLERLTIALRAVIARHDMLRAIVLPTGEQMILSETPDYELVVEDLRPLAEEERTARWMAVRERMSHQILPTDRWPLFEVRASRLVGDKVRLHISTDALVRDAWSLRIITRDIFRLYSDPEAHLEPLELSFRDYVLAEAGFEQSRVCQRSRRYWLERLQELPPPPELPLAREPATIDKPRFRSWRGYLPRDAWQVLKRRGNRIGISPTALLLTVFAEVLRQWCKSPRFTINLTLFNRLPIHPQVNDVVGDFTSLTLLAAEPGASEESFEAHARRLQGRLWEDLDHRFFSGVRVLRELTRMQGGERPAIMPVVFTSVLGYTGEEEVETPIASESAFVVNQTPQVWLDHQVAEEAGALRFTWAAVEELFPEGLIDDMFSAYRRLVEGLAADARTLKEVAPRLMPSPQQEQRRAVNDTAVDWPEAPIYERFVGQVRQRGDAPAIVAPERTLSYRQVDRLSGHLAARLRQGGARADHLVAVFMDKGWEQMVAVLAIVRSGAAYVPIDPDLPRERIDYLLRTCDIEQVVTQPRHLEAFAGEPLEVLAVVDDPAAAAAAAWNDDEAPPAADDLAYVIFTSGSTGQPKGVMIDHRAAVNTLLDIERRFDVGPRDRVLALSALSFDLSVYDVFGVLGSGGAVVLPAAEELRDPAAWTRRMAAGEVTVWNTVPALLELLVEYLESHPHEAVGKPRLALLSGDWIPVSLPDRARRCLPGLEVVSLGGATEASIWSIFYPIETVDPNWRSVPYGKPLANQSFAVLDRNLEPRPVWVAGDLYIGGRGLARGYWRDQGKTDAAFLHHPRTGERLYRTGDLGRYLPDGNIEFLGREDHQVKVQGYRIELGEIEAALAQHPDLTSSIVTLRGQAGGARRLAAYYVPRPEAEIESRALAEFLASKLPAYMVPADFVRLDALPLTDNGKVDRAALPEPTRQLTPGTAAASREMSGVTERIAELVGDVLQLEQVDLDANLQAMGASSIDMVRLANQLEDEFGFRPRLADLFQFSITSGVSEYYEALLHQAEVYGGEEDPANGDHRWSVPQLLRDPQERAAFKERYPGLRRFSAQRQRVALDGEIEDFKQRLLDRRSRRVFGAESCPVDRLSGLLSNLRQVPLNQQPKYLYASAGGLYPIQCYLYLKPARMTGAGGGTYYYDPVDHALVSLRPETVIDEAVFGWISQPIFNQAAFALFLVARYDAIVPMYGARSRDFSLIECGLIAQLLEAEAVRHELGLCQIGSVRFESIQESFEISGAEGYECLHCLVGGPLDSEREAALRAEGTLGQWEEGSL